jgi:hypothetical protein
MPQITVNEAIGDFTHIIKLDFTELQAIGTGNTKTIFTLPVGSAVDLAGAYNSVDLVGSTTTVVDVGYSGTATAFISQWNASTANVGAPVFNTGSDFVQTAGNTTVKGGSLPVKAVSSATGVLLKVTDSALSSLTAGQIIIGLRVINLARFA